MAIERVLKTKCAMDVRANRDERKRSCISFSNSNRRVMLKLEFLKMVPHGTLPIKLEEK